MARLALGVLLLVGGCHAPELGVPERRSHAEPVRRDHRHHAIHTSHARAGSDAYRAASPGALAETRRRCDEHVPGACRLLRAMLLGMVSGPQSAP